jgi:CheY-like chemotaxis protein
MAITVVLAVGLDSRLLATHTSVWRSAGYFVESADSIGEAIDLFNGGDFDLVVLGDSISIDSGERLTRLIRATGSQTPVVVIGNSSLESDWFADSTLKSESNSLLKGLRGLLAEKAKMRGRPATLHGDGSLR